MPRMRGPRSCAEVRSTARRPACSDRRLVPAAGMRFPAPVAGGKFPAPVAGGKFPAPVALAA